MMVGSGVEAAAAGGGSTTGVFADVPTVSASPTGVVACSGGLVRIAEAVGGGVASLRQAARPKTASKLKIKKRVTVEFIT
jgi:hypothetical protein